MNGDIHPVLLVFQASMRDSGYSFETSIADLIDNCISAGASIIDIICDITAVILLCLLSITAKA